MKPVVISIVLSVLLTTTLGATVVSEPNNIGSELKFVIDSNTPVKWTASFGRRASRRAIRSPRQQTHVINPSLIEPTYVACIRIRDDNARFHSQDEVLGRINDSPITKRLSKSQQDFLKTGLALRPDADPKDPYHYYVIRLYAVSEEDAELMARAYLDGEKRFIDQCISVYKRDLSEKQEKLRLAEKELSEKEKELKACEEEYKPVKDNTYRFSSEEEASKLAKETILEMDKALDMLEIELAGIREKLNAIEKYRNKTPSHDAIRVKLDEMFIEQMVELSGLEARRLTTNRLLAKQPRFLGLFNERNDLQREVTNLRNTIGENQRSINSITESLLHPKPNQMLHVLPPKVYQNTITIYPVITN
jgi:hypothetical protein